MGLYFDVIEVLKKHGYVRGADNVVLARAQGQLLKMVEAFEGKEPVQRFNCPCGWSGPVSDCTGNECPDCGWKSQGTFPRDTQ